MPKSKRAKVVHLSKVEKKGKEHNEKLFSSVREAAENYQYCYVFSVENMRNNYLKDVRAQFPDSRLFFGKTKVMAKSLGLSQSEEYLPNLSELTPHISGDVGLLFSPQPPEAILDFFDTFAPTDFARAGIPAVRTFTIPEGIVYSRGGEIPVEQDEPVEHSRETQLRGWGLPTRLVRGKIVLDSPHTVCEEGQVLNSHQTALLKMFGIAMAEFRVQVTAYYDSANRKVTIVDPEP